MAGIDAGNFDIGDSGYRLRVWTVTGARPGPVLALTGAIHGDELEGPLSLSRLLAGVDPGALAGRLIVCPVANPMAVAAGTRSTPQDGLNLARTFPGDPAGSPTQAVAALIAGHVIGPADALVDLHSGGVALGAVFFAGYGDGVAGDRARAMALSFGAGVVWRHAPPMAPGRTLSVAEDRGIPAIYVEASGGTDPSGDTVAAYALGVHRVMAHLGMVAPPAGEAPGVPLSVSGAGDTDHAVMAEATGLCAAQVALGQPVRRGQPCLEVTDPGGRLLETISAPSDGIVMFLRRSRWVSRGDLAMALAVPD